MPTDKNRRVKERSGGRGTEKSAGSTRVRDSSPHHALLTDFLISLLETRLYEVLSQHRQTHFNKAVHPSLLSLLFACEHGPMVRLAWPSRSSLLNASRERTAATP